MEDCEGIHDWLKCPECKHICTSQCPLESPDVITELSRKYSKSSRSRRARSATILGDTGFEFSLDETDKIN